MNARLASWLLAHPPLAAEIAGGEVTAVRDEGGVLVLDRAGAGPFTLAARGYDVAGREPDDPDAEVVPPQVTGDGLRVAAVAAPGVVTWAEATARHPGLAPFARRERLCWPDPLERPAAEGWAEGRDGLHRVAEVVAAAREALTGNEIALRGTAHGFRSPWIEEAGGPAPEVVTDDGPARLVLAPAGDPVTTLEGVSPAGAAEALVQAYTARGATLALDPARFPDRPIPPAPAGFAEVTAFATAALKRARLAAAPGPGQRVNLWPEHFDQAFERGEVTCGLSPGDETDPRPYLYVLTPNRSGDLPAPGVWREQPWPGAFLPFDALCHLPSGDEALDLAAAFYAAGLATAQA